MKVNYLSPGEEEEEVGAAYNFLSFRRGDKSKETIFTRI